MNSEVVIELVKVTPTILWMLFIGTLIFIYRKRIDYLLRRMSGFKAFGLELTFFEGKLDQANEKQAEQLSRKANLDLAEAKRKIATSEKDRSQLLRRINHVAPILEGAQVLWVDDHLENNEYEIEMLRSLDVLVDVAESTGSALQLLERKRFDVIISDMERNGVPDAGLRFITEMQKTGKYQRTILYVGYLDTSKGTPAGAFAITNRPNDLIHYIMDALERERGK